jgi:hypothetical protein
MRIKSRANRALHRFWVQFTLTPFGCLLRLFTGRMFHGGELGSGELDAGMGTVLILMAMPGLFVSLLTFEKYGHLILWLRGGRPFDPFKATLPDEYFFIVLSLVVSAGAALWLWDSIFLDRRDYTNVVPLPVKLSSIFLANLCAILFVTALFTTVANAASVVLFPIAVVGSQSSLSVFLRFAGGHFISVLTASAFGCFAVFGLTGAAPDTNIPSHFASGAIPDGDRSAGPSDQQLCRSGTVVGDSDPDRTAPRVTAAVFVPGADQDDVGQRG